MSEKWWTRTLAVFVLTLAVVVGIAALVAANWWAWGSDFYRTDPPDYGALEGAGLLALFLDVGALFAFGALVVWAWNLLTEKDASRD